MHKSVFSLLHYLQKKDMVSITSLAAIDVVRFFFPVYDYNFLKTAFPS